MLGVVIVVHEISTSGRHHCFLVKIYSSILFLIVVCLNVVEIIVGISVPPDGMSGPGEEDPVRTG